MVPIFALHNSEEGVKEWPSRRWLERGVPLYVDCWLLAVRAQWKDSNGSSWCGGDAYRLPSSCEWSDRSKGHRSHVYGHYRGLLRSSWCAENDGGGLTEFRLRFDESGSSAHHCDNRGSEGAFGSSLLEGVFGRRPVLLVLHSGLVWIVLRP